MAELEPSVSPVSLGPLGGVVFPTRRRTVGQAGWEVAKFCQNIIHEAGSIQKALFPYGEPQANPIENRGRVETSLTLLWSNPRASVEDHCPGVAQKLALG